MAVLQNQSYNSESYNGSTIFRYGQSEQGFPESRNKNFIGGRTSIRCFICDKEGHKYTSCRRATSAQIMEIRARLHEGSDRNFDRRFNHNYNNNISY